MTTPGSPDGLAAEVLAGQLICVPLRDYSGDRGQRERFLTETERNQWGGVIVFGGDAEAVRDLVAEANELTSIPLLVCGDFERGFGQQFPRSGTTFPSIMALAAGGDARLAREVGEATGHDLRAYGFHVNLAPVADVAVEVTNPIAAPPRTASDDPVLVADVVSAVVEGLQRAGVGATLKHFPGHGRTTVDSHSELPVVTATREALFECDLVPFRAGIDAGARVIMPAHVAFPALDSELGDQPATFSRAITTDLLRSELGFEGLVCSDALMMGAVSGESAGLVAQQALLAGIDWLLYPPEPDRVREFVAHSLETGTLDDGLCRAAVRRLLGLKLWAFGQPSAKTTASPSAELARAAAEAALTASPAEPPGDASWPDDARWVVILDGGMAVEDVVIKEQLAQPAARDLLMIETAESSGGEEAMIAEIRRCCSGQRTVCALFSPIRAWKGRPGLSRLGRSAVAAACGQASEAVLLNFSNPNIVREIEAPSRNVWAYGEDAASQSAAIGFLRGQLPANGRLPVDLRSRDR